MPEVGVPPFNANGGFSMGSPGALLSFFLGSLQPAVLFSPAVTSPCAPQCLERANHVLGFPIPSAGKYLCGDLSRVNGLGWIAALWCDGFKVSNSPTSNYARPRPRIATGGLGASLRSQSILARDLVFADFACNHQGKPASLLQLVMEWRTSGTPG